MAAKKGLSGGGAASVLYQLLCSVLVGIILGAAALFAFAGLMVWQALPHTLLFPFSTVALCLGCFTAAHCLAGIRKAGGLFCGLACAMVFVCALYAWSLYQDGSLASGGNMLRAALLTLVGCLGGYRGMLAAEQQRRNKSKHT